MADQIDLTVTKALDGARVDKAVAALLNLSRARASTLMAHGVTLDGLPAKPSDRVATAQVIRCDAPEAALELVPEEVDFGVLFEDDHVLVIDKPAGLVVHPGSGHTSGTLAAGLIYRYPELVGVGSADRWGLIHRLDKDTSGALLVARREEAFESLVGQLRAREVQRTYSALVEGRMGAPTGTIEAPIGRDPARPTRRGVVPGGKHARTHYEVVHSYPTADLSLLEVTLETGRTHQIRVHLAAIDHPVVGDRSYGATRKDIDAPRTFLHASRVGFTHPGDGSAIEVEAPLAVDLVSVLDRLGPEEPTNDSPAIPLRP